MIQADEAQSLLLAQASAFTARTCQPFTLLMGAALLPSVRHTAVDVSEARNAQAQVMLVVSQVAFRVCRGMTGHRHLTGHGVQANVGVALFWSFSLLGVN
jgi:hypothetical protein